MLGSLHLDDLCSSWPHHAAGGDQFQITKHKVLTELAKGHSLLPGNMNHAVVLVGEMRPTYVAATQVIGVSE